MIFLILIIVGALLGIGALFAFKAGPIWGIAYLLLTILGLRAAYSNRAAIMEKASGYLSVEDLKKMDI